MAQNQTMQVYEALKKKIDEGFYSPAESLREAALSEEYSVSRNTIKKALLMLENDAYVTIEQNKGARVRSYSKSEVMEFLELRSVLEGFVAKLTAAAITQEALDSLKAVLDTMQKRHDQGDLLGYSEQNHFFHSIIYDACPNRMTVDVLTRIKSQMKKYNSKTILIPGRADQSIKEHIAIYNALCQRDAEKAQRLMENHIQSVRSVFEQYYEILF